MYVETKIKNDLNFYRPGFKAFCNEEDGAVDLVKLRAILR